MTKDELVQAISKHDDLYWKKGAPVISDEEYDVLVESLRKIDPNHPLVNRINTPEVIGGGKVKHKEPMLSLGKVYTIDELVLWCTQLSRTPKEVFIIEYKYDGCSASFESGILATRGDGHVGENITSKLPIIHSTKNDTRGEIIMPKSVFLRIKEATGFKNTRNAVAGILNRDVVTTEYGKILYLIPFNYNQRIFTIEQIMEFLVNPSEFNAIIEEAKNSEFPTDGLVIKLLDKEYAKSLGATSHHARGEIAFKFSNPTGQTILRDIEWSVGKHVITPIGKVDPVEVSGVTISNINLHNMGYIIENGIHIGDTIIVERAGDVIPDVQSIIPGENRIKIKLDKCPACGHPVTYEKPVLVCNNYLNCEGGFIRRLMDSVVRIGIERLGLPTLEKLVESLKVENLIDIFNLTKDQIRTLDGFGDRSAENLYEEIQKVVRGQVEDWRVLSSLNLVGIGTSLSKTLLSEFLLDELRIMTETSFINIAGIGPERAAVLVKGLNENSEYIDNLLNRLTVVGSIKTDQQSTSGEKRIKICFTGKFEKPKSYYYGLLGPEYEVTERLESDTSILVVANPTIESNKTKTAKKKGIKIIGINDLFKEG